jgi:hypothetical protein
MDGRSDSDIPALSDTPQYYRTVCTCLFVAVSQNSRSVFLSSGVWPYSPHVFSVAYYFPASVNYRPYPNYNPTSAIDHDLSVSLSKT